MQSLKKLLNLALLICILAALFGLLWMIFEPSIPPLIVLVISSVFALPISAVLKPPKFKCRATATEGSYPTKAHRAAVLILVSVAEIKRASKEIYPIKRDWSYEWQNLVECGVGPYCTKDVAEMEPDELSSFSIVIVTRSASAVIGDSLQQAIKRYIQDGGVVISEGPSGILDGLLRFEPEGGHKGRFLLDEISHILVPNDKTRLSLSLRPIYARRYRAVVEGENSQDPAKVEVLASLMGSPSIFHFRLGQGHLICLAFDLSTAAFVLKQGIQRWRRPFDRILHVLRFGWCWPKPAHFIPELSYFVGGVVFSRVPLPPFQEVLADSLFRYIALQRPFPLLSRLPAGKGAFLILTHDEDYAPDELASAVDEESAAGIRSTAFMLPDCKRADAVGADLKMGPTEIAFHWNRFRFHLDRKGIHFNRFADLESSLKAIEGASPDAPISSSRIHWLVWDEELGTTFDFLASAGILTDSSQGSISSAIGYIFGTGYGYRPLLPDGRPLSMLEVPYEIEDDLAGADVHYFKTMIDKNLQYWRSGLVVLLHPWQCVKGAKQRPVFEAILEAANREDLWVTTLSELHAFRQARLDCQISSKLRNGAMEIEVETDRDDIVLELLPVWENFCIQRILRDGSEIRLDGPSGALFIPTGKHVFRIEYRQIGNASVPPESPQ
ncbi:MAG: hypothetical protein JW941_01145 [Candidatus Coatesbacteria bacterium]|nr:hypothetical protein [Candidatus Coatesbacteria bacterium]